MRFARIVVLFAIAVTVAMALAVSPASATNAVLLQREDSATSCPNIAGSHPNYSGGCYVHFSGELDIYTHLFGFEAEELECHLHVWRRVSGNLAKRIVRWLLGPGAHLHGACDLLEAPPCTEAVASAANKFPWAGSAERDADGVIRAHYDVCIDPAETAPCEGELVTTLTETGAADEVQREQAMDLRIGASSLCEVDIDVSSEKGGGSPDIAEGTHIN